ncbi:MAG: FKBP-type peptidyl-prolyl cis-trans isomerase [Polyangiaceae bacterium]
MGCGTPGSSTTPDGKDALGVLAPSAGGEGAGAGELKIEVVREPSDPEGTEAVNGHTMLVHYTGRLEDGTVFDSTRNPGRDFFTFKLGEGMVIKGWDQGLLGMRDGEIRKLTVPSHLAYGEAGVPGRIPPNATLTFEIELLEIWD